MLIIKAAKIKNLFLRLDDDEDKRIVKKISIPSLFGPDGGRDRQGVPLYLQGIRC